MKRIFNLDKYYEDSKYSLNYFNKLINDRIRKLNITKKDFFKAVKISSTSFNRSINSEQKIGNSIVKKLNNIFDVNPVNKINKQELEILLEEIYLKFYYKKDISNYEYAIDDYINMNTPLTPILYLFKFLIKATNYKNPKQIFEENVGLYNEINSFDGYYIDEFRDLLILLKILFRDIKVDYNICIESSNIKPLIYQALVNLAYRNEDFALVIYYGEKAKKEFQKTLNFERVASLNLTLFLAYNVIGEFEVVYNMSFEQCNYYLINDIENRRTRGTIIHFCISCIGLEKYNEAIEMLNKIEPSKREIGEYLVMLVIYHKTNNKEYDTLLDYINIKKIDYYDMANLLDKFLTKRSKPLKDKLKEYGFNKGLLKIIEKME